MLFSARPCVPVALACACSLALASSVDARSAPQQATFRVTLSAQITKTWDYVTSRQEGACTVSTRVRGSRRATLTSIRPTLVKATASAGQIRFSPSLVRSVRTRITQGGSVREDALGPGCAGAVQRDCARTQRRLEQTLRFFRSRPREISFRRAPEYTIATTCPPEANVVRAERPGVHAAQGRLSERDLFARRIQSQTVSGEFEEETEISGAVDGRVVERVRWNLTFVRLR